MASGITAAGKEPHAHPEAAQRCRRPAQQQRLQRAIVQQGRPHAASISRSAFLQSPPAHLSTDAWASAQDAHRPPHLRTEEGLAQRDLDLALDKVYT